MRIALPFLFVEVEDTAATRTAGTTLVSQEEEENQQYHLLRSSTKTGGRELCAPSFGQRL